MDQQLETLLYLDTRLRTAVLRAIIARWRAGEREIASEALAGELAAAGLAVPGWALACVFDNLRARRLIDCRLPELSSATSQHGDTRITWVQPALLGPREPERRG